MVTSHVMLRDIDTVGDDDGAWPLLPVALGLAALWFILAWPWLSGTFTIPWDGKAHFAPQVQFLAASIARGEWPWWTPNVFAGHPQIADPQSMIFSPPMLLLAVVDPAPSLWAIDLTVLLTVLFGGVGVLAYARHIGWLWPAAMIAALVFMFGGSMAWRLQHFGQVMSLAYLPWALLAINLAVGRGFVVAGIFGGLFAALILLGRDQVGLLSIYVLIAYAAYQLFADGAMEVLPRTFRALPAMLAGIVTGLAVIAVPLMLTLAFAAHSQRPSIDFDGAGAGSLHPGLLITLFSANLYGAAGEMMNYWGPPSLIWENTGLFIAQNMGVIYIGAIPLIALGIGVVRGWVFEVKIMFFTIAAGVCLVYALGWYTPGFRLAYEALPGIDKFRRPADATFLVGALAAFVVGWVVNRALAIIDAGNGDGEGGLLTALTVTTTGLAIAIAIAVYWGRLYGAVGDIVFSFVTFAVMIAIASLALWIRPIRPVTAGIVLSAGVAMDLGVHNGPNGANALPSSAISMLEPDTANRTVRTLQSLVNETTTANMRPRVEFVGLGYHWPNASLTHGFENTLGANPVRLSWFAGATGAGDTVARFDQRAFSAMMPSYTAPLARLLGLTYVVTGTPLDTTSGPGRGLSLVAEIGPRRIYRTPAPLPRVVFATRAIARAGDPGAGQALPDIDYLTTVLLAPGSNPDETGGTGKVTIQNYRNTQVVLSADSTNGGWVVLHDVWHPWWRVTVGGKPARLLRANGLFRGVRVPPGAQTITFRFHALEGAWADLFGGGPRAAADTSRPGAL